MASDMENPMRRHYGLPVACRCLPGSTVPQPHGLRPSCLRLAIRSLPPLLLFSSCFVARFHHDRRQDRVHSCLRVTRRDSPDIASTC